MKGMILSAVLAIAAPIIASAANSMPTLHAITAYTFQAPYSCKGSYEKSALFLSDYSKQRNAPDLLFNGACQSPLYIEASTAGDDFSLIADLGPVSLETVNAMKAFDYAGVVGTENSFKESMPVAAGHTYVVLISKSEIRALFALTVDEISPDGPMKVRYAALSYSIQSTQSESSGFNWEQGNH